MSVFDVDSRQPFTAGVIAIVAALVAAVALVAGAWLAPVSIVTFLFVTAALALLTLAGWLAFQLQGYLRANYTVDRNAFVIRWGWIREVVPMGDVQRVIAAADLADGIKFRRVLLPGWWQGAGRHPALGAVSFYATEPMAQQIIVVTPERNFAVSPYDAAGFLEAFKARFEMQPTQPVTYSRTLPAFLRWRFWSDRVARLLLFLAIALNLGVFGMGTARYPTAPAQVPLHFDAAGLADRIGPRSGLFGPAYVALALLVINVLLGFAFYVKSERLLALLLWGGGSVIQLLFAISVITVAYSTR